MQDEFFTNSLIMRGSIQWSFETNTSLKYFKSKVSRNVYGIVLTFVLMPSFYCMPFPKILKLWYEGGLGVGHRVGN